MSRPKSVLPWWLMAGVIAAYIAAMLSFLTHDLAANPQYDNQVLWYAADFVVALKDGTLAQYVLEIRKYPFLYTLPFATTMLTLVSIFGGLTQIAVYAMGRSITLVFALAGIALLSRLSRAITGSRAAVVLLMSSILWLQFSTAIRPHVPVAFWTLSAFAASCLLRGRYTLWHLFLSFGAAAIAAATLQSGFLAFIFPLWALLWRRSTARNIAVAAGAMLTSVLAVLIAGYPFLLSGFFGGPQADVGIDLGHNVGLTFDPWHLLSMMLVLPLMEPLIAVSVGWGIVRLYVRRDERFPEILPIAVYACVFVVLFGTQSISAPRFFLPVLPLLALLGARAFASASLALRSAAACVLIAALARVAHLAWVPSTYQQAGQQAKAYGEPVGFLHAPSYFYGVPPEKMSTGDPLPSLVLATGDHPPGLEGKWLNCKNYPSGARGDDTVLLWGDSPFVWWHIATARSMGPVVHAYCLQK